MGEKVWSLVQINELKPGEHFAGEILLYAEPQEITFERNSMIKCKTRDEKSVVCRFEMDPESPGLKKLE
uniref:Uncharacterized protein n=1 Tax=Panagrolaimus sp. JU765 TaxID=591449 RepID=A0AC34Q344_9BILA